MGVPRGSSRAAAGGVTGDERVEGKDLTRATDDGTLGRRSVLGATGRPASRRQSPVGNAAWHGVPGPPCGKMAVVPQHLPVPGAPPRHPRVRPGKEVALLAAAEAGALGAGSEAGDEYLRNMADARPSGDGRVRWVEVRFCAEPPAEERPFWGEFFEIVAIREAHPRARCRDENETEPSTCSGLRLHRRAGGETDRRGRRGPRCPCEAARH